MRYDYERDHYKHMAQSFGWYKHNLQLYMCSFMLSSKKNLQFDQIRCKLILRFTSFLICVTRRITGEPKKVNTRTYQNNNNKKLWKHHLMKREVINNI